ncbi:MAG TPA: glutathionylspermidine synthase family protein [Acidobacteriaceae bacterium]|nr:glutathionylspermidine synthase family protein [Acidobacteriaceae bacterium]
MQRHRIVIRPDWQQKVESVGLTYHTVGGQTYWDESAYWEFSPAEVDRIEAATNELQTMCLAAGDFILTNDRLAALRIPQSAWPHIRETWNAEPPALYGRMDLAYNGGDLKLLEYNADTPTSLVEAAVAQWYWLEERFPEADQFNSIHERLVAKWKDLKDYVRQPVYFAFEDNDEDAMTVTYLRDTAQQAGLQTAAITMEAIGWDSRKRRFVDEKERAMETIFKLYPWESLIADRFGKFALDVMGNQQTGGVQWIEPVWKMLWSNKALLAVLWEMYPNHELLLPAYLDGPRDLETWVCKPLLGREGANVTVKLHGITVEDTAGRYADGGFVWQQYVDLTPQGNPRIVVGSWLANGEACGMGIREPDSYVTTNASRFVPHLIR